MTIDRVGGKPRRLPTVVGIFVMALLGAGCGGDSGGGSFNNLDAGDSGDAAGATSDDIDVCGLLSDAEIESLMGAVLVAAPGGPDSPYPSCSWDTGRLIVQVASGDSLVFAPGQDCPAVDIGDEGAACPGSVQFVMNGSRVLVQTIDNVTEDQLVAVARALEPKIVSGS